MAQDAGDHFLLSDRGDDAQGGNRINKNHFIAAGVCSELSARGGAKKAYEFLFSVLSSRCLYQLINIRRGIVVELLPRRQQHILRAL